MCGVTVLQYMGVHSLSLSLSFSDKYICLLAIKKNAIKRIKMWAQQVAWWLRRGTRT